MLKPFFNSTPSQNMSSNGAISAKTTILITICSCNKTKNRRLAQRNTWLKNIPPHIKYFYYLGKGANIEGEDDCVILPVKDDYSSLTSKATAALEHSLACYDFDYLVKFDDDNYVDLERLTTLCKMNHEYVGCPSITTRGFALGGGGIIYTREFLKKVLTRKEIILNTHPTLEDIAIGRQALNLSTDTYVCPHLTAASYPFPLRSNDMICAHWLVSDLIKVNHKLRYSDPIYHCEVKHKKWEGTLILHDEGVFYRENYAMLGTWDMMSDGNILLNWTEWGHEILVPHDSEYKHGHIITAPAPFYINCWNIVLDCIPERIRNKTAQFKRRAIGYWKSVSFFKSKL